MVFRCVTKTHLSTLKKMIRFQAGYADTPWTFVWNWYSDLCEYKNSRFVLQVYESTAAPEKHVGKKLDSISVNATATCGFMARISHESASANTNRNQQSIFVPSVEFLAYFSGEYLRFLFDPFADDLHYGPRGLDVWLRGQGPRRGTKERAVSDSCEMNNKV